MAAELGLISLTHLQKLVQSHHSLPPPPQPPNSMGGPAATWVMNNNNKCQDDCQEEEEEQEGEDEESNWEVKAFEEDTNHAMGTTWPPRSYTCTFCRREFRSAQALGGHMNVHRRDRARLHHSQPYPVPTTTPSPTSPGLIIPAQDFMPNGGLCLVYSLQPNPNTLGGAILAGAGKESRTSSSKLLSDILPHPHSSSSVSYINFPVAGNPKYDGYNPNHEEIDLELRLGRAAWPSS